MFLLCSMLKWPSIVWILAAFLAAASAYASECKDDPEVVGRCFKVHGRVFGTVGGRVDLSPVGADPRTGRIFGVAYPGESVRGQSDWPWMPDNLRRFVNMDG